MVNDLGKRIKFVGFLIFVEIIGINDVLFVGDCFVVFGDEK